MAMSVLIYVLYDYHGGYRGITINLLNLRQQFFASSSETVSDIYSNFFIDTVSKTRCAGDYLFPTNSKRQYTAMIDNMQYPRTPVPLYMNKSIDFECLREKIHSTSSSSKPLILFWNERTMFGNKQLTEARWCPIRECELTHDKTRLYESDLVITHMVDKIDDMPVNYMRSMHQRWIFYLLESPVHSKDYTKYNGFYNMSSTYKHDSDFTVSYRTNLFLASK